MQLLAVAGVIDEVYLHHVHVAEIVEVVVLVPHVCHAARHAGGEVAARLAEHHHASACHVLAAVVARSLYHGRGTGVAHAETLAHLAVDVQLAAGGSVQAGVARYDVVLGGEIGAYGRQYRHASAREALGEVVVGLALELEVYAAREERAEALSGRALEPHVDGLVGQSVVAVLRCHHAAEHGSHGAVGVLDGEVEVHLVAVGDGTLRPAYELLVEHVAEVVVLLLGVVERAVALLAVQHTAEVEQRCLGAALLMPWYDELGVADDVVETAETHLGEVLAHLLRQEREVVDDVLIVSAEVRTQLGVLRGHAHGAGVEVALAHHDASEHDERCRAERELLGSEQGHEHHVAAGLELSVHLQAHLSAQSVLHERLLGLAQTYLWRYAREAHARRRRCASAALGTRYYYEVALGLGHAGGYGAHAALRHELHADGSLGVDVLEVEDELCQVLYGVDVVVWRR